MDVKQVGFNGFLQKFELIKDNLWSEKKFKLIENYKYFFQALSRRIHYGKFVAEIKFRDAPKDYEPAIRAKVKMGP